MTISPVASTPPGLRAAASDADFTPGAPARANTPEQIAKAARQFEAIMVRQLLSPSIEPMMNGGALGAASENSGGGGGAYGYMLTDVLATSITEGGGLGLAGVISRQLSPASPAATPSSPTP